MESDDRQQDVVTHTGALLGSEKISRGSAEIGTSLVGADRRGAAGIDYRVNAFERRVQAVARYQVDAERAADAYDFVALPLKDRDSAGTDIAGRAGYRDSHG